MGGGIDLISPFNLKLWGTTASPSGRSACLWQGWGNLNNGANDGLVASNGRNDLGNANANNGSRNCKKVSVDTSKT